MEAPGDKRFVPVKSDDHVQKRRGGDKTAAGGFSASKYFDVRFRIASGQADLRTESVATQLYLISAPGFPVEGFAHNPKGCYEMACLLLCCGNFKEWSSL